MANQLTRELDKSKHATLIKVLLTLGLLILLGQAMQVIGGAVGLIMLFIFIAVISWVWGAPITKGDKLASKAAKHRTDSKE